MQVFPDLFGVEGIHTDNQLSEILALTKGSLRALAVGQAGFAPSVNSLVGIYLYGDKTT